MGKVFERESAEFDDTANPVKQTSRQVMVTVTDKTEYRIIGSDTEPGVNYVVTVVNDIPRSCDCPSFTRTIKRPDVEAFACKHMNRVYAQIKQRTGNLEPWSGRERETVKVGQFFTEGRFIYRVTSVDPDTHSGTVKLVGIRD